ncbi:MAG: hypothetical protein ACLU4P_04740 [Ruminococcus sp.]
MQDPKGRVRQYDDTDHEGTSSGRWYRGEELESIDVLSGITDVYPPVFCMTSVADHQKAQAPALVQKLMENNVPFVYRVFGDKVNKLGHVFHCDVKTIDAAQCNDAECDFFRWESLVSE